jgi:hypothetical protein
MGGRRRIFSPLWRRRWRRRGFSCPVPVRVPSKPPSGRLLEDGRDRDLSGSWRIQRAHKAGGNAGHLDKEVRGSPPLDAGRRRARIHKEISFPVFFLLSGPENRNMLPPGIKIVRSLEFFGHHDDMPAIGRKMSLALLPVRTATNNEQRGGNCLHMSQRVFHIVRMAVGVFPSGGAG